MKRHLMTALMASWLAAGPASAQEIALIAAADLDWQSTPEGVAFAALDGDRFAESYQAMVRLPAGIVSPPHVKSADMFGVMLEGQMVHYASGADPAAAVPVGPGGFYHIPSGLPHVSACVSEVPCVAYLYQDGAFDFLPVQTP